jgi:hypothetical protein
MNAQSDYITDWFMPDNDLRTDAAVAVAHQSRMVGLYRVKGVGKDTMTLSHGGISFPVGTKLEVDDFQKLIPSATKSLSVKVVENNRQGIQIAW